MSSGYSDSKGTVVPLSGGRVLPIKGDLPDSLKKEFPWLSESLVCQIGGEKEKLSNLSNENILCILLSMTCIYHRCLLLSFLKSRIKRNDDLQRKYLEMR